MRRWSRCVLGWPRGSPVAAVHFGSGWLDAQRLIAGRLLSLFGRITSIPIGDCSPLPAIVSRVLVLQLLRAVIYALLWRLSRRVLLMWVPAAPFSECESGSLSVVDGCCSPHADPVVCIVGLPRQDTTHSLGRSARHLGCDPSCALCGATGDLFHCLAACPAFTDLRTQ